MDEYHQLNNRMNLMQRDIQILERGAEKLETKVGSLAEVMYAHISASNRSTDMLNGYIKGLAAAMILIPILGTLYNVKLLEDVKDIVNPVIQSFPLTSTEQRPADYLPEVGEYTPTKKPSPSQLQDYALRTQLPPNSPPPCPLPSQTTYLITDVRRYFDWSKESLELVT